MSTQLDKLFGMKAERRSFMPDDRLVTSSALVGIEIEMEGFPAEDYIESDYWKIKKDGSLRGKYPYEAVFYDPLAGHDVVAALKELEEQIELGIEKRGKGPDMSERTSVHVHIDVRDLTTTQLARLMAVYMSVEKLLYTYCGKNRDKNIFCLPLYEADADIGTLAVMGTGKDKYLKSYFLNLNKYSGINFGASVHYGSVEFRMHPGEWRSDKLLDWVNILLSIKVFAKESKLPITELPLHISASGVHSFITEVFGENLFPKLFYQGCEKDIMAGIRLAQDVVYSKNNNKALNEVLQKIPYDGNSPFYKYKEKYPREEEEDELVEFLDEEEYDDYADEEDSDPEEAEEYHQYAEEISTHITGNSPSFFTFTTSTDPTSNS